MADAREIALQWLTDILARAHHDTTCPSGADCRDDPATWDRGRPRRLAAAILDQPGVETPTEYRAVIPPPPDQPDTDVTYSAWQRDGLRTAAGYASLYPGRGYVEVRTVIGLPARRFTGEVDCA